MSYRVSAFKVSRIISDRHSGMVFDCSFGYSKVGHLSSLLGGYFSPMVPNPLLIA